MTDHDEIGQGKYDLPRLSISPSRAVFDRDLPDDLFRILAAISVFTNSDGVTWISLKRLGALLPDQPSPATLSRKIHDLVARGYVRLYARYDQKTGARQSNLAQVVLDFVPQEAKEAGARLCDPISRSTDPVKGGLSRPTDPVKGGLSRPTDPVKSNDTGNDTGNDTYVGGGEKKRGGGKAQLRAAVSRNPAWAIAGGAPSEDVARALSSEALERMRSEIPEPYWSLADAFVEESGVSLSPRDSKADWILTLSGWLEIGATPDIVREAVRYARGRGLAVSRPGSVDFRVRDRVGALQRARREELSPAEIEKARSAWEE